MPIDRRSVNVRVPILGDVRVPWYTAHGLGVLLLLAGAIYVYQLAVPPPLITLQRANAVLKNEMSEYGKHYGEPPEQAFADPDGALRVQVYDDHCVTIQTRNANGRWATHLVMAGENQQQVTLNKYTYWMLAPVLHTAGSLCMDPRFVHPRLQGTRNVRTNNECIIQVYRLFDDGCEHWQNFNICSGAWETNPDGTPLIHWIRCIH